jgi:hypothetical protein
MLDLKFLLRVLMLEDIMAAAIHGAVLAVPDSECTGLGAAEAHKVNVHAHFATMVELLTRCARMQNAAYSR